MMILTKKDISNVIERDGLVNDYEFEREIYKAGLVEDFHNYLFSREMIYSGAV